MKLILFALLMLVPVLGFAQEADAPSMTERAQEIWDTITYNWDVFLMGSFFVLTAVGAAFEGITRLVPTQKPDGFLARAGQFVDKLLAKFPNRVKNLPQKNQK